MRERHRRQTEVMPPDPLISDDELDDLERELVGRARRRVLEIGAGRGENFGALPADVVWQGLEPDAVRREELARRAREWGHGAVPMDAGAERVPLPDGSVDAVIGTYVLCTVPDVRAALNEMRRVLVPGGRMLFVEHVLAPRGWALPLLQRAATPFTVHWCAGCHQNRDSLAMLAEAGFIEVDVRRVRVRGLPLPPTPVLLYEGRAPA
jgi:ubiquinone/menaquinone biosynthesis C-methylase UbiE